MSTTDKVVVYDKPCPCGKGNIKITECSPDHPYAKAHQTFYRSVINCDVCKANYTFVEIEEEEGQFIALKPKSKTNKKLKKLTKMLPRSGGIAIL